MRKIKYAILICCLFYTDLKCATSSQSQKPVIAVLNFETIGSKSQHLGEAFINLGTIESKNQQLGEAVAENLRTALIETDCYRVVERNQLEKILKEHKLRDTGIINTDETVKIGKILDAQTIVLGSITKMGEKYTLNVRFVDIETGVAKFAKKVSGKGEEKIPDMIDDVVQALVRYEKAPIFAPDANQQITPQSQERQIPQKTYKEMPQKKDEEISKKYQQQNITEQQNLNKNLDYESVKGVNLGDTLEQAKNTFGKIQDTSDAHYKNVVKEIYNFSCGVAVRVNSAGQISEVRLRVIDGWFSGVKTARGVCLGMDFDEVMSKYQDIKFRASSSSSGGYMSLRGDLGKRKYLSLGFRDNILVSWGYYDSRLRFNRSSQ